MFSHSIFNTMLKKVVQSRNGTLNWNPWVNNITGWIFATSRYQFKKHCWQRAGLFSHFSKNHSPMTNRSAVFSPWVALIDAADKWFNLLQINFICDCCDFATMFLSDVRIANFHNNTPSRTGCKISQFCKSVFSRSLKITPQQWKIGSSNFRTNERKSWAMKLFYLVNPRHLSHRHHRLKYSEILNR